MAWNHPEMRDRLVRVDEVWRTLLRTHFASALDEYGIDFPLEATVALVVAFNKGIQIEQLSGISTGHRELLDWIDAGSKRRRRERSQAGPLHLLADRARHARRDVAIARELRNLVDGVEIDWLAQDPVTRVCSSARASAFTRPAAGWRTSRATSSPSRPSTTCTGPGAGWTRS